MTKWAKGGSYLKKILFLRNILDTFSFLCREKLKKKMKNEIYLLRRKKKIYISRNASLVINLIFKNFLLTLGREIHSKLELNKRTKFNTIDLIENNSIEFFFLKLKEIFWRNGKNFFFSEVKRKIPKKKINKLSFFTKKKLKYINPIRKFLYQNSNFLNDSKNRLRLKKKIQKSKLYEKNAQKKLIES